jgi:hypothetical protein
MLFTRRITHVDTVRKTRETDAQWVYQDAAADNFRDRRFYAMSDVLTVASVPEPATFALLGLGMAGFAAMRRRRSNA